jgi:hypothetical protein
MRLEFEKIWANIQAAMIFDRELPSSSGTI